MKADLKETSFIIHYRYDSEDRFYNLKTILNFFDSRIDYHELFLVNDDAEFDPELQDLLKSFPDVKVVFIKNEEVYKRPLCFKLAAGLSTGKVLCFYDIDVLIKPNILERSQKSIIDGVADHVYPYNGMFINLLKNNISAIENYDFEKFESYLISQELGYVNDDMEVASNASMGGVYLISKEAYNRMGQHDERFLGWGFEDNEFYNRSSKVNTIGRITTPDAVCWHIDHKNPIRMENPFIQQNAQLAYAPQ